MNKWFDKETTIDKSIKTYYVIDYLKIVSDYFILINLRTLIEETSKNTTLVVNNNIFQHFFTNPSLTMFVEENKFYCIISPDKLDNMSAHTITYIPVKGKLFYYYYLPFIFKPGNNILKQKNAQNYTKLYKQIYTTTEFELFYFSRMFQNIMHMLFNNISDSKISWALTNNINNTIIPYYSIEIKNEKVEIQNNLETYTMPNYFNETSTKLFMMKFVNIFYRDAIPYTNEKYYYTNNGIFPTKMSSSIFNSKKRSSEGGNNSNVMICNWNQMPANKNQKYIKFQKSNQSALVYLASYDYFTYRSVIANGLEIEMFDNISIYQNKNKILKSDLIHLYNKFKDVKDYSHNILNYINHNNISYEKYLFRNRNKLNKENVVNKKIADDSGMHWGMPEGLYVDISSLYKTTLECFATEDNHFLDNYCDPFNKSFFDLKYVTEECLLINPPFTEVIIKKTLFKTFQLLNTNKKISAYIFLPLWYDLSTYFVFINLYYKYVIHFPQSVVYSFPKKKNITSKNIKQQLIFLSNKKLSDIDILGIEMCIKKLLVL